MMFRRSVDAVSVNWVGVFNRLFKIIDRKGTECYYSGPRFIRQVQEIEPDFPNYSEFIEGRSQGNLSTTRRDYFKDILIFMKEPHRFELVNNILAEVGGVDPVLTSEIRATMGMGVSVPSATIPSETWNATRLNQFLNDMDTTIADRRYDRTVTLAYTCFEGFLGAFLRAKDKRDSYPVEIIDLAKEVRDHLRKVNASYPGEVLNLITNAAHAVDRARNRFSESHFADQAEAWLAIYIRDLVNTQIRLLLHFM
jgi:hypothetical protein